MPLIQHIYKQVDSTSIFYSWFASMHTRVDIVLSEKEDIGKQIVEDIYKKLHILERIGNYYNPSSELSAVNNIQSGTPIIVSNDLFTMIKMCIDYNEKTAGYFDISIDSDNYSIDTSKHIFISDKDSSITLNRKGIRLNLSGFIKGYALDAVKNILEERGISNALINMGNSSVLALGNHPLGDGWKVGIDFPSTINDKKEIILRNKCLTTSGNHTTQRKHIKSPYTGEYIEGMKGISVITDIAAEGEALSTALFAAEPEMRTNILQNFEATIYNL